jgi:aminoglycoside phosphotransferase (APT) family kinase protein
MQHQLGLAMVESLVALAAVDVAAVGLTDLGHGESWLERQVPRWLAQLDSYAGIDGQGEQRLPFVTEVSQWLTGHLPADTRSGLVHGDFHFGNVLVRPDRAELAAIIDWELATIGDPLLDLGQLLATWPVPGTAYASRLRAPGLPEPPELITTYVAATRRDSADVHWFHVLACLRLGILLEGTHARSRVGKAPRAVGETLHGRAVGLLQRAAELCAVAT